MPHIELRPHQAEAVGAVVDYLGPPGGRIPPEGLRTQVIAATGSGKTLIAVESAPRLSAGRVLVLDLLTQMAGAWRRGGRRGAMVGVCDQGPEESDGSLHARPANAPCLSGCRGGAGDHSREAWLCPGPRPAARMISSGSRGTFRGRPVRAMGPTPHS
ncbi:MULTISPECIES: DEAD/DEAH box helicase family protein [unclassified Streptomyces]|uniref:DEAD/DEAH box helicase family protein n=1 Tax=unclassified Streptomyces TaxID=2593676 RepID=UPI000AC7B0E2